MATLISESNFRPSISPMIDQQFDLDEVLALADEYSTPYDNDHHEITTVSEASQNPLAVDCMPISTVEVDSNCAVCMENFYSGETGGRITCGHVYHASCITAWLSICNSCPLCRSRISGAVNFCAPENNDQLHVG